MASVLNGKFKFYLHDVEILKILLKHSKLILNFSVESVRKVNIHRGGTGVNYAREYIIMTFMTLNFIERWKK